MDQQALTDALSAHARKRIPSGGEIVKQAIAEILKERGFTGDVAWLKANFSMLVEDIQIRAFEIYLKSQAPAADSAFREVLGSLLPKNPTADQLFDMLRDNFFAIDRFFLSLGQGRKARAGGAMETVILTLLQQIGYPHTSQPKIDGQPDFLFPSIDHFHKMPVDCINFTVKRTLRERWRQITTEGSKGGLQFFLATIDEGIHENDLNSMKDFRVWVVVPSRIKDEIYSATSHVISFEVFFDQHLDPAMVRWKKNKVIA